LPLTFGWTERAINEVISLMRDNYSELLAILGRIGDADISLDGEERTVIPGRKYRIFNWGQFKRRSVCRLTFPPNEFRKALLSSSKATD
jgi:hypothetical protein